MCGKFLRVAAAQLSFRPTLGENVEVICGLIAEAAHLLESAAGRLPPPPQRPNRKAPDVIPSILAILLAAASVHAQTTLKQGSPPNAWPGRDWPTATPESQGMSSPQ